MIGIEILLEQAFTDYLNETTPHSWQHQIEFKRSGIWMVFGKRKIGRRYFYRLYPDISDPKFDPREWAKELYQSKNDETKWSKWINPSDL